MKRNIFTTNTRRIGDLCDNLCDVNNTEYEPLCFERQNKKLRLSERFQNKNDLDYKKTSRVSLASLDNQSLLKIFQYIPEQNLNLRLISKEWNEKITKNCMSFWIPMVGDYSCKLIINNTADFLKWSRRLQLIGLYKSGQIEKAQKKISNYVAKYLTTTTIQTSGKTNREKRNVVHMRSWLKKTFIIWPFENRIQVQIILGHNIDNDFRTGRRKVKLYLDSQGFKSFIENYFFTDENFKSMLTVVSIPIQFCKFINGFSFDKNTQISVDTSLHTIMPGYQFMDIYTRDFFGFCDYYCQSYPENSMAIEVKSSVQAKCGPFWEVVKQKHINQLVWVYTTTATTTTTTTTTST